MKPARREEEENIVCRPCEAGRHSGGTAGICDCCALGHQPYWP